MNDHLADVQRYDADADPDIVQKIVKHLGIALQSRDASIVSCSDQNELDRVRDRWSMKKLGQLDESACDTVIQKVCEVMSDDRQKKRVTFYYLVAKDHDQLGDL